MSLWDLSQQVAIRNMGVAQGAAQAASQVRDARQDRRSDDMEERLGRLLLLTEAMWTLLVEKTGVTVEELATRIEELDASDGKVDGQRRKLVNRCASCGAAVPADLPSCQYCGATNEVKDPFARI